MVDEINNFAGRYGDYAGPNGTPGLSAAKSFGRNFPLNGANLAQSSFDAGNATQFDSEQTITTNMFDGTSSPNGTGRRDRVRMKLGQYQSRMGATVKGNQAFSVGKSGSGSANARRHGIKLRNNQYEPRGAQALQYQTF